MHLGHGHGFQSHLNQRLSQSHGHGFSNHRNGPLSHRNTLPHHRIQYLARQDYSNLIVTIMTEGHDIIFIISINNSGIDLCNMITIIVTSSWIVV